MTIRRQKILPKISVPKTAKLEKSLKKTPLIKLVYIALAMLALTILIIFLLKDNLPPEVPLFYGLPEGNNQLTTSLGLIIPSLVSLFIIVINLSLSVLLNKNFLQQSLILTAFVITLFSVITSIKILFLVGSF